MKHQLKRSAGFFAALVLMTGIALGSAQPAHASVFGDLKICRSSAAFDPITVIDNTTHNNYALFADQCTTDPTYHASPGLRVDTDPNGTSHSYKLKPVGVGASGEYGPCHTNSDNHASDPPQSDTGQKWTIYYRNYDHGNCTN